MGVWLSPWERMPMMVHDRGRAPDGSQFFEEMLAFELKYQQVLREKLIGLLRQRATTTIVMARELGENEAVIRAMLLQLCRENVVARNPAGAADDTAIWSCFAEGGEA